MKRPPLSLSLAMFALCVSQMADAAPRTPPARLSAVPARIDLGELAPGEKVESSFQLVNKGETQVQGVRCKAPGFSFDKGEVTIAPGSAGVFRYGYTSPSRARRGLIKISIACGPATIPARAKIVPQGDVLGALVGSNIGEVSDVGGLGLVGVGSEDAPKGWQRVAGDGFSVELPTTVKVAAATLLCQLGALPGTEYTGKTSAQSWVVGVYRVTAAPRQPDERFFESAFRGGLGYLTVVRKETAASEPLELARQGKRWAGRRFRYSAGTSSVEVALYLVGDHLYSIGMVASLAPNGAVSADDQADFERAVASFELSR